MNQQAGEILASALSLSVNDRMMIASELLQSVGPEQAEVTDADWLAELRRRRDQAFVELDQLPTWTELKANLDG